MTVYRQLLEGILSLVAPPLCPGCDLPLRSYRRDFCSVCESLIESATLSYRPPASSAALYLYGGPLAEAMRRYKYDGCTEFAEPLGRMLCKEILPYAGCIDRVIPMPLHPIRLRHRGFNQSALLAKRVSRYLGVPLDVGTLIRVRNTSDQALLDRYDRALNVQGAFRARSLERSKRILLIDDIRTTGATFASAAEVLLDAGASTVYTLALAVSDPSQL